MTLPRPKHVVIALCLIVLLSACADTALVPDRAASWDAATWDQSVWR